MVIFGGRPVLEFEMVRLGTPETLAASRNFHAGNRCVGIAGSGADCANSEAEESEDSVAVVDANEDGRGIFVTPPD